VPNWVAQIHGQMKMEIMAHGSLILNGVGSETITYLQRDANGRLPFNIYQMVRLSKQEVRQILMVCVHGNSPSTLIGA